MAAFHHPQAVSRSGGSVGSPSECTSEGEGGEPTQLMPRIERAEVEERLGGSLFYIRARVVEGVQIWGGDVDDPDELELGVPF